MQIKELCEWRGGGHGLEGAKICVLNTIKHNLGDTIPYTSASNPMMSQCWAHPINKNKAAPDEGWERGFRFPNFPWMVLKD